MSTNSAQVDQTTSPHRFGVSISLCIAAIIRGDAQEEEVEKIVAGTRCPEPSDWESVIKTYRNIYWKDNPDLGEQILRRFLAAGKIEQPRVDGRGTPLLNTIWVDSLDNIKFFKESIDY